VTAGSSGMRQLTAVTDRRYKTSAFFILPSALLFK
jgi:hypothetical protein